jgi:hypothetical protein
MEQGSSRSWMPLPAPALVAEHGTIVQIALAEFGAK